MIWHPRNYVLYINSTNIFRQFFFIAVILSCSRSSKLKAVDFPIDKFNRFVEHNRLGEMKGFPEIAKGLRQYVGKCLIQFRYRPSSTVFRDLNRDGALWNIWTTRAGSSIWLYGQLENQALVSNLDEYNRSHFNRKTEQEYLESVGVDGRLCDVFLVQIFENKRISPSTQLICINDPISLQASYLRLVEKDRIKGELTFPLTGPLLTKICSNAISKKYRFSPPVAPIGVLMAFDYSISMKSSEFPSRFEKTWKNKGIDQSLLFQESIFLFPGPAKPLKVSFAGLPLKQALVQGRTDTIGAFSAAIEFANNNRIDHLIFISKNPDITILNPDDRIELPVSIKDDIGNLEVHFLQLEGKEVKSLRHGLKDGAFCPVPFEELVEWVQKEI